MSELSEFFLGSRSSVKCLDLIELSHPNFSQTYRLVRNEPTGVTVTLETAETAAFDYYPMRIQPSPVTDDLDFSLQIDFGDLGEIIPAELDMVAAASGFDTMPTCIYRSYRSDDLTAPMDGPVLLEVGNFIYDGTAASLVAKAPELNIIKTGEVYSILRFPGLRGFL